jgi:hypothetical protein
VRRTLHHVAHLDGHAIRKAPLGDILGSQAGGGGLQL